MSKVSIIIPIYNMKKYLTKCLDSVIHQTLKDIEIICIDDGSTDNSLEILKAYAQKDPRIKVLTQENQGQGAARNLGIDVAESEYVSFVDPDDWIEPDTYEYAYNTITETGADYVTWGMNIIPEEKRPNLTRLNNAKAYHAIKFTGLYDWDCKLYNDTTCTPCNKIFKTSIIKENQIKFPNIRYYEDEAFFAKYLLFCKKVYFSDKFLYNYIQRKSSVTALQYYSKKSNHKLYFLKIFKDVYDYYEQHNALESHTEFLNMLLDRVIPSAYKFSYDKQLAMKEIRKLIRSIDNKILKNRIVKLIKKKRFDLLPFMTQPKTSKLKTFLRKIFCIEDIDSYKIITVLGIKIKHHHKKGKKND